MTALSETADYEAEHRLMPWLMVGLAFLSQGAAYGMTFGLAGSFIGPVEAEFHASRAASSLGVSLVALLHGLLGPVVGRWLAEGPVRRVMVTGAITMSVAYAVMYFAPNIWVFDLGFGVLGGVAVSMLGVTPVVTLIGRWFPTGNGRALGLANMPILVTILPLVGGVVTAAYGWRTTVLGVGVAALLLAPLLSLVREPLATRAIALGAGARSHLGLAGFRPDLAFWLLALAGGVLDGSGITIITHIVPYATEAGLPYRQATFLVSVMGVCGLLGAPLLGILADRITGPVTLSVVAVALGGAWVILIFGPPYGALVAIMALLGFCGAAFAGLIGTALANRYSGTSLGPAIGLAVLCALPFNFLLPLLAGEVHDLTGTYRWAFTYHVLLFAAAALMFFIVAQRAPQPAVQGKAG